MKSKLSLRKKVIIEIMSPTIVTIAMGIISIKGQNDLVTDIILVLAVIFFIFMLFNAYRKNFEPEDEMSKRNQQKADSLSFNMLMIIIAVAMLYSLKTRSSVILSLPVLLFTFAGMSILNLIIFLFFDIRGN